ncbi:MAG: 3-deoxy-manno-octulosonate cytidylyltransferase [Pseudomonadota bacterium]
MTTPPFHIVIPARMASTRLPGKPLLDIAGKPMIQHVWERCREAQAVSVTIATDSQEIVAAATAFGAQAMLTREDHQSGTDRIAEVAEARGWGGQTCIVNVQGDEPLMPPAAIRQVAQCLADTSGADLATLATPITDEVDKTRPDCVKVVCDEAGKALYFSRSLIPFPRTATAAPVLRHLGIYAYRADSLLAFVHEPPCDLERTESLEQLRALWIGQTIAVAEAVEVPPPGVDTQSDLDAVAAVIAKLSS